MIGSVPYNQTLQFVMYFPCYQKKKKKNPQFKGQACNYKIIAESEELMTAYDNTIS